jgi:hypothetical protein
MRSDDLHLLALTPPNLAGDASARDLTLLDAVRYLSTAKPPKVRPAQAWPLSGIGRGAKIIIASTGLMMAPQFYDASSDVELLADANGRWLGCYTQPTGVECPSWLRAQKADSSPPSVDRQLHVRLLTAPIAELSREALAALSITKTQMSHILGIERPHFYQWLKGTVTTPSKAGRLRELLALLRRSGINPQDPLRAHLLTEPLEPGAMPLLVHMSGDLKSPVLVSALLQAADLNRTITREAGERIARMRAKGHDTSIDEAAQANLDTTLTMMEWDNA